MQAPDGLGQERRYRNCIDLLLHSEAASRKAGTELVTRMRSMAGSLSAASAPA